MTEREKLRRVIRDLHGVDSSHLRSEPVHETFQGQTVWEGVVEVFALKGGAGGASRCGGAPGRGRRS